MSNQITTADLQKFAYHEGARHIRAVLDRVCELAYLEQSPADADRDFLCDSLIELHQILYAVTLFMARAGGVDYEEYAQDEVYSDGQPIVSRMLLPGVPQELPIPPGAYHGDIGEEVPPGIYTHVWRPGENFATHRHESNQLLSGPDYWKRCADLRVKGFIAWVRDHRGGIVKRPGRSGRLQAVSSITDAGLAEHERISRDMAARREPLLQTECARPEPDEVDD